MKIKNLDILVMNMAINSVLENKAVLPTRFVYALMKNREKIKSDVELLDTMRKPSERFMAYERARIDLNVKYAKKENGEPVIVNGSYEIEDLKEFNKEYAKLADEFKDDIEETNKRIEEFNEVLNEEIEIDLYKVNIENLPKDISTDVMSAIMPFVEG